MMKGNHFIDFSVIISEVQIVYLLTDIELHFMALFFYISVNSNRGSLNPVYHYNLPIVKHCRERSFYRYHTKYHSWFFEIPVELVNLPDLLNISAKLKKNCGCQTVTHLVIKHASGCLTSVIWPFILTAFTFRSCLHCVKVSQYKDGWAVDFVLFHKGIIRFPS